MTIGESMREARIKRGLSRSELGDISGVDPNTIRVIEMGYQKIGPRLDTVILIADGLGISIDELIGREVPKEETP